jgi:hypothetical protein
LEVKCHLVVEFGSKTNKIIISTLQIIGTILAYRFRNLANPRITPPGNVYDSPPSGITIS